MRVAVLTNAYPPDAPGGAARIAETQVRMLEAAGLEVKVFHPPVAWLGLSSFRRLWYHFADLASRPEVVAEILAWKPEVLLSHNLTGIGFGTPKAVQASGVRWIHMLHDVQLFEPSGRLYRSRPVTFWQWLWGDLRWFALGKPDLVLSPTRWLLRQHQRRGFFCHTQTTSVVLPNPGPKPEHVVRQMHAPVRLLFVGGVSKEKGTRFLTRVLKALKVPFQLQVVGEGPDLPWLAKRFPKSVFHGRQSTAEILALMKTCDLLLVPSRILENQPTVILEAASVGLPVLATPRGGALETLGDLGWGPQHIGEWERGARDWARLIERLVHAPDGYQPLVERMRALAMQHDPDAYAAQFVSLLKSKA